MKQFVAAFVVVLSAEQAFGWWNASCPCESPPALFSETGTVTTVASEIAAGEVGETAAKNLDNISKLPIRGGRFSDDASALIDLARQSKKKGGISEVDAATLLEWAKEYNVPFHGPEQHINRNFKDLHIHIGPIDHIKVNE